MERNDYKDLIIKKSDNLIIATYDCLDVNTQLKLRQMQLEIEEHLKSVPNQAVLKMCLSLTVSTLAKTLVRFPSYALPDWTSSLKRKIYIADMVLTLYSMSLKLDNQTASNVSKLHKFGEKLCMAGVPEHIIIFVLVCMADSYRL